MNYNKVFQPIYDGHIINNNPNLIDGQFKLNKPAPLSIPPLESRFDLNIEKDSAYETNPATLVINSEDRDKTKYPNNNKYNIDLITPYRYVTEVELLRIDIPSTSYNINNHNNKFIIIINDITYNISINIGDYTINDLMDNIINNINNKTGNIFSYNVCINTKRVTIYNTNEIIFTLNFDCIDTIKYVLGFENYIYYDNTTYTGENSFNLRLPSYIILKIKGLERLDSNNNSIHGAFCLIFHEHRTDMYVKHSLAIIDNEKFIKVFNPPLERLETLEISFYDNNGYLYDFHGVEHLLIFNISSMSRPGKFVYKNRKQL